MDQICRALSCRFPGQTILNVIGIRREESAERAKARVANFQPKLSSVTRRTVGVDWRPIIDWTINDVLDFLATRRFRLHEAYTVYGASRVSCAWCILASEADHRAGARDGRNHTLGRRMVDLEIKSTFAFQGSRWLGDTLAGLITTEQRAGLERAKRAAEARQTAEGRLPKHLLYTKGWPTCILTHDEAALLAEVRCAVAAAVGLPKTFIRPSEIIDRYRYLITAKQLITRSGRR